MKTIEQLEREVEKAEIYCMGGIGGREHNIACRQAKIALEEAQVDIALKEYLHPTQS